MQETGPTVYSPYPRRLDCLTICWYNYKGSTFSSVIHKLHCIRDKLWCQCHLNFFNQLEITKEVSLLLKVTRVGMFELHCDELIRALAKRADGLRTKLLQRMSKDHQLLNKRYCNTSHVCCLQYLPRLLSLVVCSVLGIWLIGNFSCLWVQMHNVCWQQLIFPLVHC